MRKPWSRANFRVMHPQTLGDTVSCQKKARLGGLMGSPKRAYATLFWRISLATTYSHRTFRPTTIGAAAFHFRVRDGNGWFHRARVTRIDRTAGLSKVQAFQPILSGPRAFRALQSRIRRPVSAVLHGFCLCENRGAPRPASKRASIEKRTSGFRFSECGLPPLRQRTDSGRSGPRGEFR